MPQFRDVSNLTSPLVIKPRRLRRRGIVVHETIGINSLHYLQVGSIQDGRYVSADYLIARNGDVFQITPPGYCANHSGQARWNGYQESDTTINQGFIGVELENNPELGQRCTNAQYIALAWLIRRLMSAWPIDIRNIVGHYQVALPVGRKTDPITLDWTVLSHEMMLPSIEAGEYHPESELS